MRKRSSPARNIAVQTAALLLLCGWCAISSAREQPRWTFDPAQVVAAGPQVMQRAPDAVVDQLFQAVAFAARQPAELKAMCAVLEPDARHDLASLNDVALRFGEPSRLRFDRATQALLAARRRPAQPFNAELAKKALSQAAVTAAFLFDGFAAGISATGKDSASRAARCQSLGQLLDTVGMRPLPERAMITRLLMREGYARIER